VFKENPKHEIRFSAENMLKASNSKQILNHKSQIPNTL